MIEAAAEHDEELMDGVRPRPARRRAGDPAGASARARIANKLHPVFVGSALKYVGVQRLLDGVVAYLPSPLDKPVIKGHKPDDETKEIPVKCDPDGSLVALAFKITADAHGDLYFLRIYQGTLKSGSRVLNPNRDKKENITRLFEMHANERKIDGVGPGGRHRGGGGPAGDPDRRYALRHEKAGGSAEHYVPPDGDHHVDRAPVGRRKGETGRRPGVAPPGGPDVLIQDRPRIPARR